MGVSHMQIAHMTIIHTGPEQRVTCHIISYNTLPDIKAQFVYRKAKKSSVFQAAFVNKNLFLMGLGPNLPG